MPVIGTEKIDGRSYEILVTEDGTFCSEILGERVTAPTKADLVKQLRSKARKAKVRLAISATLVATVVEPSKWGKDLNFTAGVGAHTVTITGLHSQNGDVLLRLDGQNGKSHRWSGGGWRNQEGVLCARLTPTEDQEYRTLHQAFLDAQAAYETFINAHRIKNPKDWVSEQVNAAVDDPKESPTEAEPTGDPRIDAEDEAEDLDQ
jgi:hypothetical protein